MTSESGKPCVRTEGALSGNAGDTEAGSGHGSGPLTASALGLKPGDLVYVFQPLSVKTGQLKQPGDRLRVRGLSGLPLRAGSSSRGWSRTLALPGHRWGLNTGRAHPSGHSSCVLPQLRKLRHRQGGGARHPVRRRPRLRMGVRSDRRSGVTGNQELVGGSWLEGSNPGLRGQDSSRATGNAERGEGHGQGQAGGLQ